MKKLLTALALLCCTAVSALAQTAITLPIAANAVADLGNGPIKTRMIAGNASIFTSQGSGTGSTSGSSTTLTLTATPTTPPLVGGLISGSGITSGTTVLAYSYPTITLSAAMTVPASTAVSWGAACPSSSAGIPAAYIQASPMAGYYIFYTQARVCAVSPGGPVNTLLIDPIYYEGGTGGGSGSVTSITCGAGLTCSPNPIVGAGTITANSSRTLLTGNTAFYFNKDQGSDSNNCLATGAGACATSAHVMAVIANNYDLQGFTATIHQQCASYPCMYTQLPNTALQTVGGGTVAFVADGAVTMNLTSVVSCVFCFQYVTGNWSISGPYTISSSVGSGNGSGISVIGSENNVTYSGGVNFGAFAGGMHVSAIYGGQIQNSGNFTISGGAAYHMYCADAAVCHEAAGTATLTGTPAFSSAMFAVHGSGAVIGLGNIFSGSATGLSASADGSSEIDVAAISNIPGTGTANIANSAVIGGFNGILNVGGPLVDGGISGSINFNGSTANTANFGTDANANLFQPSVPIQTPSQIFSQLIAAAGVTAYITDGSASHCGDSACTTWGTTVTLGGGGLKLLIWNNGTNWTLVGK